MTAILLPNGKQQYFTTAGAPAVGYKVATFAAGTSTPQVTWQDALKIAQNTNPVILDGRGEASIFWEGAYKVQLQDAAGAPIWTQDNLQSQQNGFSASLLPAVTNSIDLGSVALSWRNLYLGANNAPALDTLSGNIGYYKQTAAEVAALVTPTNFSALPLDPIRYGAVGDGVTDDTAAMNRWVVVVNVSTAPSSIWTQGKVFLCSPLSAITVSNLTLNANGSTVRAKGNSWVAATKHLQFTGNSVRISDLICDGNQAAFSAQTGLYMLSFSGSDVRCSKVSVINSSTFGCGVLGSQMYFTDCQFSNNAAAGMVFVTASYCHLSDCSMNYNGYGFQKTWATNVFQGFALAIRFRSHHITFTSCEALQSGRDGFNVNQGSYAIKFIGCLCWMNQDGGFTVAADSTSPGTPGDAESPYDLEYIDCEAYNNYGSGLAIYQPAYNITVDGGRYYNNYRAAGQLAQQSSMTNGIYIPANSLGIRIRTKAYDDRQICTITANAAGVLTATGWVAGTMANYPRVALYSPAIAGAGLAFQGYGTITAESAGSVTIATTAFNGVPLGSIIAGWYVTQRTQHNGVMFDNGCIGTADVDGFGQLPGPQAYMGFKTISTWFNSNQNILLPAAPLDYTELLSNPTWDSVITGWTYTTPGGGGAAVFTTAGPLLRSTGCLQLIAGTSAAAGQATLIANGLSYVANGAWVEASVWAYAALPNQCALVLNWGAGALNTTVTHPGGGWRQLRIGAYIPSGTTTLLMQINVSIGVTAYFDSASLRVRNETYDNRDFSYPTRNLAV